MATNAKRPQFTRELPPIGTYIARCYQFVHIGSNEDEFKGEKKVFNKIRLSFELPDEMRVFKEGDEPKPMSISQEYTLSMGEKANLRKFVEGMIGTALQKDEAYNFDVESLVGKACLITVIHKVSKAGNKRAEIASASPLMKNQKAPEQINPSKILSYSNFDEAFFESLPQFIKDKIVTSEEYRAMKGESGLSDEDVKRIKEIKQFSSEDINYPEPMKEEVPF